MGSILFQMVQILSTTVSICLYALLSFLSYQAFSAEFCDLQLSSLLYDEMFYEERPTSQPQHPKMSLERKIAKGRET